MELLPSDIPAFGPFVSQTLKSWGLVRFFFPLCTHTYAQKLSAHSAKCILTYTASHQGFHAGLEPVEDIAWCFCFPSGFTETYHTGPGTEPERDLPVCKLHVQIPSALPFSRVNTDFPVQAVFAQGESTFQGHPSCPTRRKEKHLLDTVA